MVRPLLKGATRLTLALDDTPTKRYGPHVQGAGVHHNPTPGPAGSPYVYGTSSSCWPCSWPTRPGESSPCRCWPGSTSARKTYRASTEASARVPDQAGVGRRAAPLGQAVAGHVGVADLGGGRRGVCQEGRPQAGGGPGDDRRQPAPQGRGAADPARSTADGERGRPRTYGEHVIDLAKCAGQKRGWSSETFTLYGVASVKKYKTFLATWRPAGGVIRVVLVDEPTGWRAYFCTDTSASVADILGMVADRFSLEITFREVKQIVGAGQQQVRFIWANIGAFHVCLWTYTMTEAWAWGRKEEELVDRSASPWDKASTPTEPRGQASGVASRIAGRGDSCGSTPGGYRGGNSGHRRTAAQPGRMTYTFSRKVQVFEETLVIIEWQIIVEISHAFE